jgi:hypothetical protein
LSSPEEFGQIVVRETPDGGIVRVKDLARVELGAQDYSIAGRLNGKPSAIVALYQLPGSNAVEAAAGVKKLIAQVKKRFPPDMDYAISLDQTHAVTEGMREIIITLVIAILLVIVVVYIFLQGWRATLIPLLAVPVSLVGTFVFFPLFGFSINTLSLFGLVLAIGLVVDDAIVVVEAVERHIEEGMAPKDAAFRPWKKSPARSSASRSFYPQCSSPLPSSPESPGGSISNSPSPSRFRSYSRPSTPSRSAPLYPRCSCGRNGAATVSSEDSSMRSIACLDVLQKATSGGPAFSFVKVR